MKLQLALDVDEKTALKICEKTKKYIDIIEIGTPLVKMAGLGIIKKFKKFRKPILADLKTMDTGFFEAELAFKAGADIATVCGCTDESTIAGAVKAARKYKKKILVDLINVPSKYKKIKKIADLNPTYLGIHTGIDMQNKGQSPLKNLKKISRMVESKKIAVAGGINKDSLKEIMKYKPEVVIVGGAITKAKNPEIAAKNLKEIMK